MDFCALAPPTTCGCASLNSCAYATGADMFSFRTSTISAQLLISKSFII